MKKIPFFFLLLIPISFLVLLDEWIKYISLQRLPLEGALLDPGVVAFAIHKNFGMAFDIPFKMPFIICISFIIGIALFNIAYQKWNTDPFISFSSLFIIIASLGNLFDRIVYGFTVDYFIFFGRSAVNISDFLIITSVLLLLFSSRQRKKINLTKKVLTE